MPLISLKFMKCAGCALRSLRVQFISIRHQFNFNALNWLSGWIEWITPFSAPAVPRVEPSAVAPSLTLFHFHSFNSIHFVYTQFLSLNFVSFNQTRHFINIHSITLHSLRSFINWISLTFMRYYNGKQL